MKYFLLIKLENKELEAIRLDASNKEEAIEISKRYFYEVNYKIPEDKNGKILSQLVNYGKLIEIHDDTTDGYDEIKGTIFNLPLSDWEKEFEKLVKTLVIEKLNK